MRPTKQTIIDVKMIGVECNTLCYELPNLYH
jgi:hypothetical protein